MYKYCIKFLFKIKNFYLVVGFKEKKLFLYLVKKKVLELF